MSKVILITGASSGLGKATALLLSRQGHRVFGTSRYPEKYPESEVRLLQLDVSDPDSIHACVAAVLREAGRIDVLVNNAGYIGPLAAAEETSPEQIRALFEINFFGVVQMTNAVLPQMRRQGSGQILNVSSVAGRAAFTPFFGFYAASKHALAAYTEALRYELRPFDVAVSLVEPGYFKTAISGTMHPPAHPVAAYAEMREHVGELDQIAIAQGRDPRRVAQTIARAIRSPRPRLHYPVGLDARIMLLGQRLLPAGVMEEIVSWFLLQGDTSSYRGEGGELDLSRLGLRRVFFDGRSIDAALVKAGLGALVAGMVGLVVASLFRRRDGGGGT